MNTIRILIKSASGDVNFVIDETTTTIAQLRQLIQDTLGIKIGDQQIVVLDESDEVGGDVFVEEIPDAPTSADDTTTDGESSDEEENDEENVEDRRWTFEKKRQVVEYARGGGGGRTFQSVKRRFKTITATQLCRFKRQVDAGGTTKQRWRMLDDDVWTKFEEARHTMLPVHDSDLRRWAMAAAAERNLKGAMIRPKWIWEWKQRRRIGSRKVCQVWSAAKLRKAAETEVAAINFRNEVQAQLGNYDHDMIMNTDQSGFQYEFYATRTLSYKGERLTPVALQSMNKTTHSYTIQPVVSLSGKMLSPLFICLQEVGGKMGEIVKKSYFRAPNIEVSCSASGKLTTSHFTYFVNTALAPMLTGNSLLLLDSWGGQKNDECFEGISESTGFVVDRMVIPPGATATTQPLDVTINRQIKIVVRHFYDYVQVERILVNLYKRDMILKMQSAIHHLFSHDRFRPMIQYAWFASGLSPDRPVYFETANDILFPPTLDQCDSCPKRAFIMCPYCERKFCFEEFFVLKTDPKDPEPMYHNHFEDSSGVINLQTNEISLSLSNGQDLNFCGTTASKVLHDRLC